MRVIAGKYKSRQLKSVKSNLTRPTTDRNKENMFNIIGPYFQGGNVLVLFAGSGGLGIEALSRGCDFLYSVDNQYAAFQIIRENIKSLKIENAKVYKLDYQKALKKLNQERIKFDLILLDPPYGNDCIIMVEELKEVVFKAFNQLNLIKKNDYGITALNVFKYQG